MVSKIPRILAQMYGKSFVITREGEHSSYFSQNFDSAYHKWLSLPEDEVMIEISYGKTKHRVGMKDQFLSESIVYTQLVNHEYKVRNQTIEEIRKLDASFECLMRILSSEILRIDSRSKSSRYYGYYYHFYLKLQKLIEVYELLEHASSYQENNIEGAIFYLTDPGFVVNYCQQSGYM